ncbi:alpha/beta hydrolase [Lactococcus petauri]|uniref:alpha/beta hydrolase n=1 Tax=Lactococcus petauri TaxID=1940789 RepID=UPI0022E89901|nr:alpha/beta hydrolase [Lactococcus petauri]
MKKLKKIVLWVVSILLVLLAAGFIYIKFSTYHPTPQASNIASQAEKADNALVFKGNPDKASVIFYQGALVDNTSYSIWAGKVAEAGYSVYLLKEPLNLAIFNPNLAEKVIKDEQLSQYIVGGHSLGGVMASRFAAGHQDNSALEGVFFLASYPDQKGSLKDFKGKVLSIVGTKDGVLNQSSYDKAKTYLPQQTINVELEGGNHAGFGSYGAQKGDNQADISNEKQQEEIAAELIKWLKTSEK